VSAFALRRPATYADLEAVPANMVGEILYGQLVTQPRPVPRHAAATSAMSGLLSGPFQFGISGPGGWVFADEPELHLGPHVVVPDLAGWRAGRLARDAVSKPHFEVAPDWVLEALSPSTERYDKGDKRRIYGEYSVGHLWHIDPRVRSLETFKLSAPGWTVTGTYFDADEVRAEPFDAIAFSLGYLWPFDQAEIADA
jgi:Putative restriction endonuclease